MDNTGVELALSMESLGSSLEQGFDLYATADKIVDRVKASGQSVKEISVAQESVKFLQVLVGVSDNYDFATMNREDIISDPDYAYKLCLEEGEGILGGIWEGIKSVWNAIWGTITKAIKWVLGLVGIKFDEAEEGAKAVKEAGKETVNATVENMSSEEIVKNGVTFQMSLYGASDGNGNPNDEFIQTFASLESTMETAKIYAEMMLKASEATGDGGLPRFETREATLQYIENTGGVKKSKNKVTGFDEGMAALKQSIAKVIGATLSKEVNEKLTDNIYRQIKYEDIKKHMMEKENMPEGMVNKNIRMMSGGTDCFGLTRVYLFFTAKKIAENVDGAIKTYFVPNIDVATVKIKDIAGSDTWKSIEEEIAKKGAFDGKAYDRLEKATKDNAAYLKDMKSHAEKIENINKFINKFVADAERNGFTPEDVRKIMALAKAGNELFIVINNGSIRILDGTNKLVAETSKDKDKVEAVHKESKVGEAKSFMGKEKGAKLSDVSAANVGSSARQTTAADIQ